MDKLLKLSGFIPFTLIVFLNAFTDLGHKILIQNTIFKIYDGQTQIILSAVVNGLILLPFILLFSPAGYFADKYRKPRVMQISAAIAVIITLLITLAYYMGWFVFAFGLTFLLAMQSAFYSPAKYGYIKELIGKERLTRANAVVQAVTIIAILSGIFVFSLLFEQGLAGVEYSSEREILQYISPIGWILVVCSTLELIFTFWLQPTKAEAPELVFDWRRYGSGYYLRHNFAKLWGDSAIWLSIVGLSIFWGISQVVLAAFPAFAKETLGLTNTVLIQGMMACSGFGIIVGSVIAGRSSRDHIETGLIPVGAVGIVLTLSLLPQLHSASLLIADFLLFGIASGVFIVPLNALIQFHAKDSELGTILAGNNLVQNLVMLGFLGLAILFAFYGMASIGLFNLLTVIALIGAVYTVYQLPQSLVRYVIARLLACTYRIEVMGFDNLPAQGGVLMLGNHISFLDWAMVQIACPRPVRFVMHRGIYQRWYLKWFLDYFGVVPIARGHSKEALEQINALLKSGEVVCIFPEGAISRNGQLGEFKRGYERAVSGVGGVILPFYLRGLWGSRFSRSSEKLQRMRNTKLRSEVIVAFGSTLPIDTPAHEVKQRVFDLSVDAWEQHTTHLDAISLSWLRSAKRVGREISLVDAYDKASVSGYRVIAAVLAFSRMLRRQSQEDNIGLLLPTSSGGVIANIACLLLGKTVVNLDYTYNLHALMSAVEQADIRHIYTSRLFIDKLLQDGIVLAPLLSKVRVVYMEDLEVKAGRSWLLAAAVLLPARWLYVLFGKQVGMEHPAAIIFSDGSAGETKGVVLSQRNIMGNIRQVSDVLDTRGDDVVMATSPLCQAFGLTVTGLLPLVEGIPLVCHPDPTDVINIARAIGTYRATIFSANPAFLRLLVANHSVHPLMLDSLRLVVVGGERLSQKIREGFKLKFNQEIYAGYGTTETTPVASVNVPDHIDYRDWQVQEGSRSGSVGMPLPGSSFRIVDPDTLASLPQGEDGLILIGGTQVMLGYLNDPQGTAEAIVMLNGKRWYKTGDKGYLDADGFLTIVGSY